MELKCKLLEKSFNGSDGNTHFYYVLSFNLIDGSTLEVSLKSDKAKLLKISNSKSSLPFGK